MAYNGPAVEFVNAALRPEAVTENLVDLLAHSSKLDPQPREQSMAWFLPIRVQIEQASNRGTSY